MRDEERGDLGREFELFCCSDTLKHTALCSHLVLHPSAGLPAYRVARLVERDVDAARVRGSTPTGTTHAKRCVHSRYCKALCMNAFTKRQLGDSRSFQIIWNSIATVSPTLVVCWIIS